MLKLYIMYFFMEVLLAWMFFSYKIPFVVKEFLSVWITQSGLYFLSTEGSISNYKEITFLVVLSKWKPKSVANNFNTASPDYHVTTTTFASFDDHVTTTTCSSPDDHMTTTTCASFDDHVITKRGRVLLIILVKNQIWNILLCRKMMCILIRFQVIG